MKSYTNRKGQIMKKTKFIFGVCKVGEKGQIVIPKEARDVFDIKPGDSLVILGDTTKGIALVKTEMISNITDDILGGNNGTSD